MIFCEVCAKLRIRESDHLKNRMRIVRLGNSCEEIETGFSCSKMVVKRSIDQKLRLRNFDARNERIELK